jgi:hypothetical protein
MELLHEDSDWSPSVYYAHAVVACTPDIAWQHALRYEDWNPGLRGALVTRVSGCAREEGELVLIQTRDEFGAALPAFYARTVRVVPRHHVVWFVYPKEGSSFRNFLDFGLIELPGRVQFNVCYYTQDKLSGEALGRQRTAFQRDMNTIAAAFKDHCEANSQVPDRR